jgi:hypothetical protein
MFKTFFFYGVLSALATNSLPAVAAASLGWDRTGEKHGIELFRREVEGSDVIALKGSGTIEAPAWKLASILLDPPRASEWVDSLGKSSMVRRIDTFHYVEYNHILTPFFMKDRDFVSNVQILVQPEAKTFTLEYGPSEETAGTSDHIRGQIESGRFELKALGKNSTLLTGEIHCDPKGSLPKWLVNFFQSDWAYETIQALRTQSAKADIHIPAEFKSVIEPVKKF